MVRQSVPDPPELATRLWQGFDGAKIGYDIGANCGQSVLNMLNACAWVVAFEPNRDSFQELARQWGSHSAVTPLNIAVSGRTGYAKLAQLGGEQAETGQLVTPGLRGMEWEPADWDSVSTEDFPCMRLDDLTEKFGVPDFLKVDTEGHEAEVLRGAQELISQHVPDWLIEFHSPEILGACQQMLVGWSEDAYDIEVVRHPHYPENSQMWFQHGWIRALQR